MKSNLKILDLSDLQYINDGSNVFGGSVKANTNAVTSASPGSAIAGASGIAEGQTTSTSTNTDTKVYKDSNISSSTSTAQATALAKTGNQAARSSSNSISIWFSVQS